MSRLPALRPFLTALLPRPLAPGPDRFVVDGAGRTAAYVTAWEPGPAVVLVDTATGRVLHVEAPLAGLRLVAATDGFFVVDEGWRPTGPHAPRRVVELARAGVRALDLAGSLLGVDAAGARIALWAEGALRIHAWPSGDELSRHPGVGMGVDFAAGRVWRLEARRCHVTALDGTPGPSFPASAWGVHGLGTGALAAGRGVAVHSLATGATAHVLPATSRRLPPPSWAEGGRLRVVLGGRPRRFLVDLDRGLVLAAPPDADRLARLRVRDPDPLWHPREDAVAQARRWPRVWLVDVDSGLRLRLPDAARPLAWTADDALLLDVGGRLEVWR